MATKRPQILIFAYFFPPLNTIACVRTWNIAKYLSRLGWDVTVVTPDPKLWRLKDDREIEKTNIALNKERIKRLLTGHSWRCLSPVHLNWGNRGIKWIGGAICRRIARNCGVEREIGWIKEAKRACLSLGKEEVDIILASGSPFCSFQLAKWLSDKLKRPYVLDYRDLWIGNLHGIYPNLEKTINEERDLINGSAAVTIVSPSWAADLTRRYGLKDKVCVISNGFDPEEMSRVHPTQFPHFAIVYAGNFYPPKRGITPLMKALKRLKELSGDLKGKWVLHYYGVWGQHVREEAERFGVIDEVILHGNVPRRVALSAVAGANLTVVITSLVEQPTLADKGMMTGKIFESLGLGTPVLLICPLGSDAALLENYKGVRAFQPDSFTSMAEFINELMEGQGEKIDNREAYSWENLSRVLNDVLLRNI